MSKYVLLFVVVLNHSESAFAIDKPLARKSLVKNAKTSEKKSSVAPTKKIPAWKIQKEKLEREFELSKPYIGKYARGSAQEYFEFVFTSKNKLKGYIVGTGEFNYRYALTDLLYHDDGSIEFKIKGKPCRARRIDESLAVLHHDGQKRYYPRLTDDTFAQN
ncbi:MAG: hypothetical protein HY22_02610 [[Candidatus Thermochlorobacteriaceae] bacterium GBChlB]|nr:MAG: hypothetical protein HY22_02610 [[Candidatus Thermochlorobacteriaceae] bacterium GBChlB]